MDVINLVLFGFIVYATLVVIPELYDYYKVH